MLLLGAAAVGVVALVAYTLIANHLKFRELDKLEYVRLSAWTAAYIFLYESSESELTLRSCSDGG